MLQTDFENFNFESIGGFTSTFVAVCFDSPYPFAFTTISKIPTLDILKLIVTALSN